MNLNKIHTLLRSVGAISLCAVAVACSDNEPVTGEGELLPPGRYPLTFVASVEGMTSRAETHDSWVDGDEIGIRIGDYPKVGRYMLNADGTVMSAVDALDWQTIVPTTVTAWYPFVDFNKTMTVSVDDQSEGLEPFDFLTGVAENQIYNKSVSMNFSHNMAKVSCTLAKDDGISVEEFQSVKVSFAGYTVASFSNGVLEGSYKDNSEDNKWITPLYDTKQKDYEALIVPQDMTEKEFIKVEFTANVNGHYIDKTLIYTPGPGIAGLQAGCSYSYKIIVKKDRLELAFKEPSWDDDGEWHPAEPASFRVYLPKVDGLELFFSENVTRYGDNIIVEGNRFEISYVVDSENSKKALCIKGNSDRDIMSRSVDDKNRYVCSYYLLSEEVTLEYIDYVQAGDYYYDDGTWGHPKLKGDKNPIGVVFRSGAGGTGDQLDKAENYNNEDLKTIHGYAVALYDAANGFIKWGSAGKVTSFDYVSGFSESARPKTPYTGYIYTMGVRDWGEANPKLTYEAVRAALDYRKDEDTPAPAASSGWYLPTLLQLIDIENLPDRTRLITEAPGTDLKNGSNDDLYWSCFPTSSANAQTWIFNGTDSHKSTSRTKASAYARAVLTF